MSNEKILNENLKTIKGIIKDKELFGHNTKNIDIATKSQDGPAGVYIPSVWFIPRLDTEESTLIHAKISAVTQVLKSYKDLGAPLFNVQETTSGTYCIKLEDSLKNYSLNDLFIYDDSYDSFAERFQADYKKALPSEKHKENLRQLEFAFRQQLDWPIHIPKNDDRSWKTEFQLTGPPTPEQLSAVTLALKETGIQFQRDLNANEPNIFSPIPGSDPTMMETPVFHQFVKAYNTHHTSLQNTKNDLLAARTFGQEFVDDVQNNPITTLVFAILGIILVFPTITLAAIYFGGTNSTKPVNDFITALGERDANKTSMQSAANNLPSEKMQEIANKMITEINNPQTVQPSTTTPVQEPEKYTDVLAKPDQQTNTPSQTPTATQEPQNQV